MSYHLRSYDATPPGAYRYEQTEGIPRVFPASPVIEDLAGAVSRFRAANGLPRSSFLEALQDVDHYTCAGLGNNPAYCVSGDSQSVALNASSPQLNPCRGCGAPA